MTERRPVSFREATRVWAQIGLLSFGGPAGQIALMHRVLVEEKRWISEQRFLHALNYCMLLPGPEAQQLATYIGWLMHRTRGGLVAGSLFVLPGFVTILALSILYATLHETRIVGALFFGLKAAVIAIVIEAVIRIGKRALKTGRFYAVAAAAFVALFFFHIPFPIVIGVAAALGFLGARWFDRDATEAAAAADAQTYVIDGMLERGELSHTAPSFRRSIAQLAIGLFVWAMPLVLLGVVLGRHSVIVDEGIFFSKAAVVTFGGAYAVLAYVAQRAVESYGWLKPGEMLDGLGLAETTPGPLIMVVEFVGFMGAYRHAAQLSPIASGVLGACMTVWVTFVPCFLFIFVGAPYVESLRKSRRLRAALSVVTAAVVGVIVNLSVWFFVHSAFARADVSSIGPVQWTMPVWTTVDLRTVILAALAMIALFRFRLSMGKTLAASAVLGALVTLVR